MFRSALTIGLVVAGLALGSAQAQQAKNSLTIDLPRQVVVKPDGGEIPFQIEDFRKQCLVNGWDDIGLTMRDEPSITSFEEKNKLSKPWL